MKHLIYTLYNKYTKNKNIMKNSKLINISTKTIEELDTLRNKYNLSYDKIITSLIIEYYKNKNNNNKDE